MIVINKDCHTHKLCKDNKPCITVQPGTRLVMEAWDSLEGKSREYFEIMASCNDKFADVNPATGPVFVEGAHPGDVLEVEIHDIRLWERGFITLPKYFSAPGACSDEYILLEMAIRENHLLYKGQRLPVEPMLGVIGTGPYREMWCQETGSHGGNMDTKTVKKGSKVLLPVFLEGALLSLGDVHAAMGDGEVFGQGFETGADIEITIRLRKDISIERPVVIGEDHVSCIASHEDILVGYELATADMGNYLQNAMGMGCEEACLLMALYGDLRICQIVNPQKTVRFEINRKFIDFFKSNDRSESI